MRRLSFFSVGTQCAVVRDVNYPSVTHLKVTGVISATLEEENGIEKIMTYITYVTVLMAFFVKKLFLMLIEMDAKLIRFFRFENDTLMTIKIDISMLRLFQNNGFNGLSMLLYALRRSLFLLFHLVPIVVHVLITSNGISSEFSASFHN